MSSPLPIAAISAVSFLPPQTDIHQLAYSDLAGGQAAGAPLSATFSDWMARQLGGLNNTLGQSDQAAMNLAAGDADNLHQVMIQMEEAKLAFQLAVQVKNRLMDAYQDVLRMQV